MDNNPSGLLHTSSSHCTQDQSFETGKYALNVMCFAADFTSLKYTRATGPLCTYHFNRIPWKIKALQNPFTQLGYLALPSKPSLYSTAPCKNSRWRQISHILPSSTPRHLNHLALELACLSVPRETSAGVQESQKQLSCTAPPTPGGNPDTKRTNSKNRIPF